MDLKKRLFIIIPAVCLAITASSYLVYAGYRSWQDVRERKLLLQQRRAAWSALENVLKSRVRSFRGDSGVIIEDLNTGWKYSLNKDKLFPAASIVKIQIMAACFQAASEGRLDLKERMVLRAANITPGSGILKSAAAGTVIPAEKLIEIMISHSDNTAANMLIERLGFDYLNGYFKRAGLRHTNLSRKMMDFSDRKNGIENYTSASDIAFLLEKFYQRKFLSPAVSEKCLAMLLKQKVNDRIPKKLPEGCPVAHKTGLEKDVCHDAGIVFTRQGDFLICVLTKSRGGARPVKAFISGLSLAIYDTYRRFPDPCYSGLKRAREVKID